jgi:hypothetical protein
MLYAGWDSPLALLRAEVIQREYEGCVIPQNLEDQIHALKRGEDDANTAVIEPLWTALTELQPEPDFEFDQPNDLEEIRARRPDGPRQLDPPDTGELLDRFHGAWIGRACGCALGKPVELLGMRGTHDMSGREAIRAYLQNRNDWPLNNYFSGTDTGDGIELRCPESLRENIAYMEPDDDIHYTLIALHVLEQYGSDFTWQNVAHAWNSCLPYNAICTAETQAILNYSLATPRVSFGQSTFATPEYTSTHRNPYREWIGAQIRADGWAYACAGMPELAAEFAYRDACWSHRANGIYGEMFCAAMTAASFIESDPLALIEIGLSEIPAGSRLAEAVGKARNWFGTCPDFDSYMRKVEEDYGDLSPVHTVNNALIVVGAMVYGDMDFHRTICTSVEAGLDTDCNGATCGSIVGAASGARDLSSNLVAPLNDTIKPLVFGFSEITMSELAERTLAVHQKVVESRAR